jgi:hypothetical protein
MAAITKLSELGGHVCADSRANELWIVRKADGTLKAGWGADISAETAVGVDSDANLDEFGGFVKERYDTDVDTAMTAGVLIDIIIPQGGHLYNVYIADPGATLYAGEPLIWTTTAGNLTAGGNVEAEHVARLFDDVLNTSRYATIIWGA